MSINRQETVSTVAIGTLDTSEAYLMKRRSFPDSDVSRVFRTSSCTSRFTNDALLSAHSTGTGDPASRLACGERAIVLPVPG